MQGFNDELYSTTSIVEDGAQLIAYKLGALHAIVGDDVRCVDYLTDDEILEMIKTNKMKF